MLDLVLFGEVDPIRHKATVKDNVLIISLIKKSPQFWGQCISDDSVEVLLEKKKQSLKVQDELNSKLAEQLKDKRIEEERHAVRQQMALEDAERSRLEHTKQMEKESAEKEMYEVFAKMQQADAEKMAAMPAAKQMNSDFKESKAALRREEEDYDMLDDFSDDDENITSTNDADGAGTTMDRGEMVASPKDDELKYVPPPRLQPSNAGSNHKVRINFTPRIFPTPMRESKAAEEEDWVAKNRRHLKRHGVLGKFVNKPKGSGDISEEDPTWLKAKGDDFYRTGDVRSALNAYSAALDLDENYIAAYSNRASCYLQLQLFEQCKLDCDSAMKCVMEELARLTIPTPSQSDDTLQLQHNELASTRRDSFDRDKLQATFVKLLVRRGGAMCHMGKYPEALADYSQALVKFLQLSASAIVNFNGNITPESLQSDVQRIKLLSHVEHMKREGDALYSEQKISEAVQKYDEVLQLLPVHVGALSNRSACHMVSGNTLAAIQDCEVALDLLFHVSAESGKEQRTSMMGAILPAKGSEKRKQWILRTLLRKAVALLQLDRMQEALDSYRQASQLDPENNALKADIEHLENTLTQQEHCQNPTNNEVALE